MNRRMDQIENELRKMKKDLTVATDAEENSRKAMDDLALVLREVSTEASEAREKLKSTQAELKAINTEKEQLKHNLILTNEKLSAVTTERNKFKNEVERLRMEADETFAAWNEKESGLVECMKKVEEERTRAQAKNSSLQDEMRKLRDILKLAMSEAVGAKAENSQLKEMLVEKNTALNLVSNELESLRNIRAAALTDPLTDSSNAENAVQCLDDAVNHKELKKVGKAFSFDMRCTGKNRRFEDLVDEKAMVKGGRVERQDSNNALNVKRNMLSRFTNTFETESERHRIDQRHVSLRKKALVKIFWRA